MLTVYALFAMGSSDTSGDDDPTLPTQRTLTELALIRLCYRRTDEIVIVLPDPDASKKTPVVYSCNAHTRAWDAYKEGDSYKDHENKCRPYGGDPSGIGQDVRECVMAVRALVGSGRFYDAAIGAVQLAMCRLNAKSASYRATADAVLARLRRVFTSHDERVGVNMDLPTADNACERRKVLADEAREVITSLEESFGDIATFHTTLRAILGQLNLVANSTMPRLGYGDSFLMFSPSGYSLLRRPASLPLARECARVHTALCSPPLRRERHRTGLAAPRMGLRFGQRRARACAARRRLPQMHRRGWHGRRGGCRRLCQRARRRRSPRRAPPRPQAGQARLPIAAAHVRI